MKIGDLFAFAQQESAQVFILSVASLWLFWTAEAPEFLLWIVGGLGAVFITLEKVRAAIRPKPPAS